MERRDENSHAVSHHTESPSVLSTERIEIQRAFEKENKKKKLPKRSTFKNLSMCVCVCVCFKSWWETQARHLLRKSFTAPRYRSAPLVMYTTFYPRLRNSFFSELSSIKQLKQPAQQILKTNSNERGKRERERKGYINLLSRIESSITPVALL
jgi:hypothetical protein